MSETIFTPEVPGNESEIQKHNLTLLYEEINKLFKSLYGNNNGETIQSLNKVLLEEQGKEQPDEEKLDEYKAKLIAEYRNYDQNLRYLVRNHLPEALFKKLRVYKIDLLRFPDNMFNSIIELMTQDLSKNKNGKGNKFNLADWVATVADIRTAVKELL